jgi:hypothetical protein
VQSQKGVQEPLVAILSGKAAEICLLKSAKKLSMRGFQKSLKGTVAQD